MGICVNLSAIKKAEVQQVHYSKNIICPGVPVMLLLNKLSVAKPPMPRMDVQKTTYKNAEQLTFHNKQMEVCFYDKYQELRTDKKGSKNLTELFSRKGMKNILRIEVRLNKKDSIKRFFKKRIVSFQDVFKESIAKRIILSQWKSIYEQVQQVPDEWYALEYLLLSSGKTKKSLAMNLRDIGLYALIHSLGYKGARNLLKQLENKPGQSSRIFATLKRQPAQLLPYKYNLLYMLDKQLRRFEWLTSLSRRYKSWLQKDAPVLYERLWTVTEAAKYTKVNKRVLQRCLQERKLSAFKFGSVYRLRKEDIIACMRAAQKH